MQAAAATGGSLRFSVKSGREVDGGYVGGAVLRRVRCLGGWSSGLSFFLGGLLVGWVALVSWLVFPGLLFLVGLLLLGLVCLFLPFVCFLLSA